jgi:hypothetical protein
MGDPGDADRKLLSIGEIRHHGRELVRARDTPARPEISPQVVDEFDLVIEGAVERQNAVFRYRAELGFGEVVLPETRRHEPGRDRQERPQRERDHDWRRAAPGMPPPSGRARAGLPRRRVVMPNHDVSSNCKARLIITADVASCP